MFITKLNEKEKTIFKILGFIFFICTATIGLFLFYTFFMERLKWKNNRILLKYLKNNRPNIIKGEICYYFNIGQNLVFYWKDENNRIFLKAKISVHSNRKVLGATLILCFMDFFTNRKIIKLYEKCIKEKFGEINANM